MSAETKPVEVVPQAEVAAPVVEAPKPVESAPVVEESTVTEPATTTAETPVVAEAPKEEVTEAAPVKEEVKEEVKPVEEGVLGYKGPGLLKSFIFQKKFFYFGSEPVESKTLSSYLRGEKAQDTANKNVAWAAHTGKGLLFFTKKASEKASPAGIFNLSDVSDITEEGATDFHFTIGGHKHTFQASSLGDRDNWVAVLKSKVTEAKELAPTVVETEEYKKAHTDLTKPVVAAAAAATVPKKSVEKVEAVKEDKKEEKAEEKKEIKEEKKEEKKARKSRSASRKRNSIFGGFGIGKKEEKVEDKKEVAPATSEETSAAVPAVEEPVVVATSEPVVASEVTEPTPAVETAPVPAVESRPTPSKRNSIFDTLKSQFSQQKEKKPETEAAPAVPAKESEPVSEVAPVIPAVKESESLATSVAAPATVPAEKAETPVVNGETKATETRVSKADKRKSSLPWLSKKEKATTSDEETEKPKSPFAKLRATVKGKSSPKTEKVAEKPATTEEVEPKTTETPVVAEPTPVVPQSTPQVSASA